MPVDLHAGHLSLRQFRPGVADTRQLYRIRNHPTVRPFTTHPALIPYRSHLAWVRSNLVDSRDLVLFLVRDSDAPRAVGFTQLRLFPDRPDAAEIGVMFREPDHHRIAAATSTALTLDLAFAELRVERVISYVLPNHPHAIAFNQSWAAVEVPSDRPGLLRFDVNEPQCRSNPPFATLMKRLAPRLTRTGTLDVTSRSDAHRP